MAKHLHDPLLRARKLTILHFEEDRRLKGMVIEIIDTFLDYVEQDLPRGIIVPDSIDEVYNLEYGKEENWD